MAQTVEAHAGGDSNAPSVTVTFPAGTTYARLFVFNTTDRVVASASCNGSAMTLLKAQADSGAGMHVEIWHILNPTTGSAISVTASFVAGASARWGLTAKGFSGADTSSLGATSGTPNGAFASSSAPSVTMTTVAGRWVDMGFVCNNGDATTATASNVDDSNFVFETGGESGRVGVQHIVSAGSTSQALSYTLSGGADWAAAGCDIIAAAAASVIKMNSLQGGPNIGLSPLNGPILGTSDA